MQQNRKVINTKHTGQSSIIPSYIYGDSVSDKDVECETLDQIIGDKGCDIIKIDTEGSELEILKGATDSLKKCRLIAIETHLGDLKEITDILENRQFSVTFPDDGHRYAIGEKS